jgi:type I restriction enzyme, R subunit
MSEIDRLLEKSITEEEWRLAEVMADPRRSFTLWAIKRQFCVRRSDFIENYGSEMRIDAVLTDLEHQGLIQQDGDEYSLTAIGDELSRRFGDAKISEYARLGRVDAAVAGRFESADKSRIEILEDDPTSIESRLVEEPLIEQLKGLGWENIRGDKFVPFPTERESFREVLLLKILNDNLRRINPDASGKEWLDNKRISQAIDRLQRAEGHGLMEINKTVTKMLIEGVDIDDISAIGERRKQRVRFIDFDHPERNSFHIINQFRVDAPGGQRYIVADVVLFINGIPLVVIDCKSPALTNPVEEAITQLLRYSNQRARLRVDLNLDGEVIEGAEKLFYYNQLLVATSFFEARAGSIGSSHEGFLEWKDTYPLSQKEVAAKLAVQKLSSQQLLVAGMLNPAHLLDILRNFIVFREMVKIIPRYVQFRAVRKVIDRLEGGKTRCMDGEFDQRGGIVWHTQGSGKSMTIVFLVRKMRRSRDLNKFKIVVVTDRKDLQEQLSETAVLTGEDPLVTVRIRTMENELRRDSPDLVFVMIQKMRADIEERQEEIEGDVADIGILNDSESILLIIDEAHRSHSSNQHAAMMKALPNAAKVGFTGTPILKGQRKRTEEIFGPFLDRYTIKQAELDGATVPILYEGRRVEGDVVDKQTLDIRVGKMFSDHTFKEKERIKHLYANTREVGGAFNLIAAKADDMLRHYVSVALPEGLKAQVVARNRKAAMRYRLALQEAKEKLIAEIKSLDPSLLVKNGTNGSTHDERTQFLINAHQYLPIIEELEFATVISISADDPLYYHDWNNPQVHQRIIARFKRDLNAKDQAKQDRLAFICVASMLLTGFDAPVEGVLYLDREMNQAHELLQTVARVNRTYPNKTHGLVVDYQGVADKLKEALSLYSAEDVAGVLMSLRDELPLLKDRHLRACAVFTERQLEIIDVAPCVELLADAEIRADFVVKLKKFLKSLNIVMPRPEALFYTNDAEQLGLINRAAARLYRDEEINLIGVGEKVRRLIDEYVVAKGIRIEVPPVSITSPDFGKEIDRHSSDRSKASEMEHAVRYHIKRHAQEDPVYYKKLSERLQDILRRLADNWEQRLAELRELQREIELGRPENEFGLDTFLDARFFDIIVEEAETERDLTVEQRKHIAHLSEEIVSTMREHLKNVDFWRTPAKRMELAEQIAVLLDQSPSVISLRRHQQVADRLVELAKTLNDLLTQ